MMTSSSTLLHALLGGLLIGAGAATLILFNGRVAGISGITANLASGQAGPSAWRAAFLLGLLLPALIVGVGQTAFAGGWPWLVISGLLVGIGTQVGSGCTSGHGVCGIARLSKRSMVATGTFMAVAMLTVFIVRHVLPS